MQAGTVDDAAERLTEERGTGRWEAQRLAANLATLSIRQPRLAEWLACLDVPTPPELSSELPFALPSFFPQPLIVVCGLQQGRILELLPSDATVLVVEREPAMLVDALGRLSLSGLIRRLKHPMHFIGGEEISQPLYDYFVSPPALFMIESVEFLYHPALSMADREWYRREVQTVFETQTAAEVLATYTAPFDRGVQLKNFFGHLRSPSASFDTQRFKGVRGPIAILDGQVEGMDGEVLKRIQNATTIVTAESAHYWQDLGIVPNFVVSSSGAFSGAEGPLPPRCELLVAALSPFPADVERTALIPNHPFFTQWGTESEGFESAGSALLLAIEFAVATGQGSILISGPRSGEDSLARTLAARRIRGRVPSGRPLAALSGGFGPLIQLVTREFFDSFPSHRAEDEFPPAARGISLARYRLAKARRRAKEALNELSAIQSELQRLALQSEIDWSPLFAMPGFDALLFPVLLREMILFHNLLGKSMRLHRAVDEQARREFYDQAIRRARELAEAIQTELSVETI